jgi:hypothetical protein
MHTWNRHTEWSLHTITQIPRLTVCIVQTKLGFGCVGAAP